MSNNNNLNHNPFVSPQQQTPQPTNTTPPVVPVPTPVPPQPTTAQPGPTQTMTTNPLSANPSGATPPPTQPQAGTVPVAPHGTTASSVRKNKKVRLPQYTPPKEGVLSSVLPFCPFCAEKIHSNALLYYCSECEETYTEQEAKAEKLYDRGINGYKCHGISMNSYLMCPSCEINATNSGVMLSTVKLIPEHFFNVSDHIRFCMNGATSSGKSMYLSELLTYISGNNIPGIISIDTLDEPSRNEVIYIINTKSTARLVPATAVGYLNPLLFEIVKKKGSCVTVFYDVSGEDASNRISTGNHYSSKIAKKAVGSCENTLMIVDPTTLNGSDIVKHPSVVNYSEKAQFNPSFTLTNYKARIREHSDYDNARRNVKLAVIFTKMDLFYNDPGFPAILKTESSHNQAGRFNSDEIDTVDTEMRKWLSKNGGDSFLAALNEFPKHKIFGVSSGSDKSTEQPRRISDPFLWLLQQNDII